MMPTATNPPLRRPERTRLALPRKIRAWLRPCIIKRDESFSLIFFLPEREYMELELRSVEVQEDHEIGGHAL